MQNTFPHVLTPATALTTLDAEMSRALVRASMAMRAAIEAADTACAAANPLSPCPRCAGKGEAHFLGESTAPGVCFRCAGTGQVQTSRKAKKAHDIACAQARLTQARAHYVARRDYLRGVNDPALDGADRGVRYARREAERGLAIAREQGEALRALVIALGGTP